MAFGSQLSDAAETMSIELDSENGAMNNKHDFILKVEDESGISSLNRFVYRCFDRMTNVWTDSSGHNIIMFVMDGEAICSCADAVCQTTLHRKVAVLPAGEPFIVEFRPGCEVLTYSFDSYLPMDASSYASLLSDMQSTDDELVAFDIPKPLHTELVNIVQNTVSVKLNETLTYLSMRKVIGLMQRCLGSAQTAKLFAIRKSELGGEICRYMKMLENRAKLTTKATSVKF